MALARDLKGESNHVLAVLGDGALTAGMTFEAINHAGHLGTRLIAVLNDNGMSISPSIGGVSRLLNLVRLDHRYELAKMEAKKAITQMPLGDLAWEASKRVKSRLHRVLLPGAFWEELGFIYIGPVDGHNIGELEAALKRARDYETKPTLIHVLTQKGKGYTLAEDNATKFHGVPPQNANASDTPSYSKVFGQIVQRLMRENERVVAITAAMLDGTGLSVAAPEFPNRVFDVGICEQHAVTLAAGLATQGFIPVVAIYSTFLQRAYDQVIHDVCIQNLPVVFAIDRAGIVGDDGKTHQGSFDISYLHSIPNMVIAAPKDGDELQHLLFTATRAELPMAIRYPRGNIEQMLSGTEFKELPIGKAEVLRNGKDVALIAVGTPVYPALDAAETLAKDGIECTVVNARFIKPLDSELILHLARETNRLLTIEENVLAGGFGSAVLQLVENANLVGVMTQCIGLPDEFIEHGPQELLRAKFGLDAEGIARQVISSFTDLPIRQSAKPQERTNR
jgi:1-deoxy-D-xylulose-5-phosphate synthase